MFEATKGQNILDIDYLSKESVQKLSNVVDSE